ncbi:MAG TPA: glycosyltransferase family 4 protein [Flavisolibacter sp.]|nr:glycosyltransferase family 4 protein [Flavisolibacter sp.]
MKVLMTTDTVGGVWTYCMELCRSLQPYDVHVHLVTMGKKLSVWQWEEVNSLENVVVHETTFRLEWMQEPWDDIAVCGNKLLQLEKELQPDIIHLNCFAYGSLPFLAPVVVVAHSDVVSWFEAVKNEMPKGEWDHYFYCVKDGLHGADKVIAPSRAKLDSIKLIYGMDKGKVIYNGRDVHGMPFGKKEPHVFSMGRIWDEAKNIRLLAEAAAMINVPVRIAGDNQFDNNHFQANRENVTYTGRLGSKQVAEELSLASIFVLPAKYEPFGLSALEAAHAGCALVLGDIPSLREIWQEAAIYCDTIDKIALAQTINNLMQDDSQRALLATKAKLRAEKFSTRIMAKQYWTLYRQLAKSTAMNSIKEIV